MTWNLEKVSIRWLSNNQMKMNKILKKNSFINILIFVYRYKDKDNFELTNFIKACMQGIAPDISEEVHMVICKCHLYILVSELYAFSPDS